MRRVTSYLTLTAATLLFAAFSASGQAARPDFNRAQTYDVQHYTIRVSFDHAARKVFGDTTVHLKPLRNGLTSVELDAVGLSFESVKLESSDQDLRYRQMAGKVVVTLDKPYAAAEAISLRFKYAATPKKGVYFVDAEGSQGSGRAAQIWTQGEPEEARHWFPAFDHPSDKATTEEYITAKKGETVIGNGELLDKRENADGTATWHYKMPVPHSTYLVSFVIGRYVRVDDRYGDVPLAFYVYPGRESTANKAFGKTKEMMRIFEDLTGHKYPYNKYDQTIVAQFQFGGMENITATTMADSEIFFSEFGFGEGLVTDLVSHELAHSWFGNLVTCRNWAELWLNEGFATFMEAVYREKANGREDYMRKIRMDAADFLVDDAITRTRHGLFNRRADNVDALFDNAAVTYHKGGAVLHQLREQVGDAAFWKGVNSYLNAHKFANVETGDLKRAMENASGQDLTWFFDQWVYGISAPRLNVRPIYSPRTKTLTLTFTQGQLRQPLIPAAFRLPVNVVVKTAGGEETVPVDLTKRVETLKIKTTTRPREVLFDPEDKVVLKTVKIAPVVVAR